MNANNTGNAGQLTVSDSTARIVRGIAMYQMAVSNIDTEVRNALVDASDNDDINKVVDLMDKINSALLGIIV